MIKGLHGQTYIAHLVSLRKVFRTVIDFVEKIFYCIDNDCVEKMSYCIDTDTFEQGVNIYIHLKFDQGYILEKSSL